MERQTISLLKEDLLCRIPALFPYIERNYDGTVETHVATDSENGSFGKIVANMLIPADVRLTNYVTVSSETVPNGFTWGIGTTIGLSESKESYFVSSGAAFLRKVLYYFYKKLDNAPSSEEITEVDSIPSNIIDNSPQYIKILRKGIDGLPVTCTSYEEQYSYSTSELENGYINGVNGQIYISGTAISRCKYIEIELTDNATNVKFLGFTRSSIWTLYPGWCFGHYETVNGTETWITDRYAIFDTVTEGTPQEYILEIPNGSTHFRTTVKYYESIDLTDSFYCYLQTIHLL